MRPKPMKPAVRVLCSQLALSWGPQKPKGAHAVRGHCHKTLSIDTRLYAVTVNFTSPRATSSVVSLTFRLAMNANITEMSATALQVIQCRRLGVRGAYLLLSERRACSRHGLDAWRLA